jgi:hypothetical protein
MSMIRFFTLILRFITTIVSINVIIIVKTSDRKSVNFYVPSHDEMMKLRKGHVES